MTDKRSVIEHKLVLVITKLIFCFIIRESIDQLCGFINSINDLFAVRHRCVGSAAWLRVTAANYSTAGERGSELKVRHFCDGSW